MFVIIYIRILGGIHMSNENDFEIIDDFDDANQASKPSTDDVNVSSVQPASDVSFEIDGMNTDSTQAVSSNEAPVLAPNATNTETTVTSIEKEEPSHEENPEIVVTPVDTLAEPGTATVLAGGPSLNMDVEDKNTTETKTAPSETVSTKESKKKKKEEKSGKLAFIIILFIIIFAVVIFLPQIAELLEK